MLIKRGSILLLAIIVILLTQSKGTAMPAQMVAPPSHQQVTMTMHHDASGGQPANVLHGKDCCLQECQCDLSLCHTIAMLPTRTDFISTSRFELSAPAPLALALSAHTRLPFRPPIH